MDSVYAAHTYQTVDTHTHTHTHIQRDIIKSFLNLDLISEQ